VLWVFTTLIAAVAQTARNAMQSSLTQALGTLGATQVRFLYGFPFALLFLALAAALTGAGVPSPTAPFIAYTIGGAVAQILGTAFMLAAMRAGSFSLATALIKTEAVQIAIFGLVILGERLSGARAAAIVVATIGVALVALKPGEKWTVGSGPRLAALGMASGAFFALSAVGFRGGILALEDGGFWLRATTTLAWSLGIQSVLLGAWMAVFARAPLLRSFALWRQSVFAGFMGAFASQFWFLGFSLTAAANVRTLALVEVLLAHAVGRRLFGQSVSPREGAGMMLVVAGVALLLFAS
jgi:drug/metabolite transporter (DMT)-like permease